MVLISVPFEIAPRVIAFEFIAANSNDDSKDPINTKLTSHCRLTDVYCFLQMIKLRKKVKSQSIKAKKTIKLRQKFQNQPKTLSPKEPYRLFQLFREMDKWTRPRG